MGFLDDFVKAGNVFNEGLEQISKSKSIEGANARRKAINERFDQQRAFLQGRLEQDVIKKGQFESRLQGLEDSEQKAISEESQDLQSRLQQAGASPAEIQAASFAPTASAMFNAQLQEKLQRQSQTFNREQGALNRISAQKIADDRREAALQKEERKEKRIIAEKKVEDFSIKEGFRPTKRSVESVAKVRTETIKLASQIQQYSELFDKVGFEVFSSKEKGKLEAILKGIQITLKGESFAALGVLTGPDLDILEALTGETGSIIGATTGIGTSAIKAKIRQLGLSTAISAITQAESRGYKLDQGSQLESIILQAGIPGQTLNDIKKKAPDLTPEQNSQIKDLMVKTLSPSADTRKKALDRLSKFGINVEGY